MNAFKDVLKTFCCHCIGEQNRTNNSYWHNRISCLNCAALEPHLRHNTMFSLQTDVLTCTPSGQTATPATHPPDQTGRLCQTEASISIYTVYSKFCLNPCYLLQNAATKTTQLWDSTELNRSFSYFSRILILFRTLKLPN